MKPFSDLERAWDWARLHASGDCTLRTYGAPSRELFHRTFTYLHDVDGNRATFERA